MKCSFCTYEFSEEDASQECGRCAVFGGCKFLKCPRCGYEMPRTPGLVKFIQGLFKKRTADHPQPVELSLSRLGTGGKAIVTCLEQQSQHERSKLMALGIMPGAELKLDQRFPSYVVTVGCTQIALDKETAVGIKVRTGGAGLNAEPRPSEELAAALVGRE